MTGPAKRIALLSFVALAANLAGATVRVETAGSERRVTADGYQATIAADGVLSRLAIGGVEFLRPASPTNRGAYPHLGQTQNLNQISASDAQTIVAENANVQVTYVFEDTRLTVTVANRSAQPLNYYICLDQPVTVVSDGKQEYLKLPAGRSWTEAVYFAGSAKLAISGLDRLWPQRFETDFAVAQKVIAGGQSATITLAPGAATVDEQAKAAAAAGAASTAGLAPPAADSIAIEFPAYKAYVAKDGCVTNLIIDGQEFLAPGVSFSRGAYFYQGAVRPMPNVSRNGNTITADGPAIAAKYEFTADGMTWTVTNKSAQAGEFFVVFAADVAAGQGPDGSFVKPFVGQPWTKSAWYKGKARLGTEGATRVWGPWENAHQVWDAHLEPNESRTLKFTIGQASAEEQAKVAALGPAPTPAATATGPAAAPPARPEANSQAFKFDTYEAYVATDGCITNLLVGGVEFLRPGVSASRGAYFYQGSTLRLDNVQRDGNTLTAGNEKAEEKLEFAADKLTWTVTNKTATNMPFYMAFDPQVNGVAGADGTIVATPTAKDWTTATFYSGPSKLTITGATRIWGPWDTAQLQILEATLSANETRTITLTPGRSSAAEVAKVNALPKRAVATAAAPAAPSFTETDLTVLSPRDLQVFQRRTRTQGSILVSGRVKPAADRLEVKVTGQGLSGPLPDTWQAVPLLPPTQMFRAELPTPAGGWYAVALRATKGGATVAETAIAKVGVGEVFVGAGQSNSTNYGQERTQQTSGMVSSFSGSSWQLADDPQPGTHDNSKGGSFWPAFGDAMYARYQVPIGVATTGHGGTSVNQWQPGGDLHNWMMTRIYELGPGGFRGVLWHQGEADVNLPPDDYAAKLTNTIWASKQLAGWEFPWFVAQVSYHNPNNPSYPNPREAQARLWASGVALEGPDTDTLTGAMRDHGGNGIHFSAQGCKAHGEMWAAKVSAWLDRVLAD